VGFEADIDTRTDPTFPRNAIYVRGRVRWLTFDEGAAFVDHDRRVRRSDILAQGFVRFIGSSVIGISARYEAADAPLPPYLKSMLGGTGTVRGFETGYEVGDTLWASSIELRVPLSRATKVGRVGLRAFVDAGDIADHRGVFTPPTRVGVGGGAFTQASLLQLGADIAYGIDKGWRVHLSSGVRF
jgi:outer membrane protein assembly factor BamA